MIATIYDRTNGDPIAEGLQGSSVCDEAIQAAKRIANESGHAVLLEDDDGAWTVYPDGRVESADSKDAREGDQEEA